MPHVSWHVYRIVDDAVLVATSATDPPPTASRPAQSHATQVYDRSHDSANGVSATRDEASDERALLGIRRDNKSTAANWSFYTYHRSKVTDLILQCAPESGSETSSLCVLGAGNCNDLDLPRLASDFDLLHLVDIDSDALRSGVARQAQGPAHVLMHAGVDIAEPGSAQLAMRTDVVASTGVWSQLVDRSTRQPATSFRLDELI